MAISWTFLAVQMCFLAAACAQAAGYHVAADGSDDNAGTKDKPFATIQKAADVMVAGDTCVIGGGTYRETVRPKSSGQKGKPIRFMAARGQKVVLDGTEQIAGPWTVHKGRIYKAPMAWDLGRNNQVFVDGKMAFEARWPNDKDGNPMTPDGADMGKGSDLSKIICRKFPARWKADDLTGVVVWAVAQHKWSSWTRTATGYDAGARAVLIEPDKSWWCRVHHNPAAGGSFYLVAARCLLDAPGEWYYDAGAKALYLCVAEGRDPAKLNVAAKRRMPALDLTGRKYIHVEGLVIRAATIDLTDAESCVLKGVRVTYLSHTRGGRTSAGLGEKTGITVSGRNNVIRDSEIAYSAGNGVALTGRNNALINCHIHDIDYMGCYASPIRLGGLGHLISHNTIHDAGRDCIKLGGAEHLIQYNDIYRPGRICRDLGCVYSGGLDGGNTVIRYNWVHGNPRNVGIYLDNYMKNYIVHHNVVWNTGNSIRMNRPTGYCMVMHNTIDESILNSWGPWNGQRDQWGCHLLNNVFGKTIVGKPEVVQAGNVKGALAASFDVKTRTPRGNGPGRDAGVVVPGINEGFRGKAPDCGAYEAGGQTWRAGHDFANPPNPKYEPCRLPLRNYVVNAAFEYNRYRGGKDRDDISPWTRTHAKAAKLELHRGFNSPPANKRFSVNGNSVALTGDGDDGIAQRIEGLQPDTTYWFAAYVKYKDAREAICGVKDFGRPEVSAKASAAKLGKGRTWRHVRVKFTTGKGNTAATVHIVKKGAGTAYVDNTGVVPAVMMQNNKGG